MRSALGLMLASVVAAVVIAGVFFFVLSPRVPIWPLRKPSPPAWPSRCRLPAAKLAARDDVEVTAAISGKARRAACARRRAKAACANPDALGVSRVVEIDTTGGPGFGFETFQAARFPHRQGSRADLRRRPVAGQYAGGAEGARRRMHQGGVLPDRQARDLSSGNPAAGAAAGHTVGAHTWSHANLNAKKMTEQMAKDEVEKGFSAVKLALGTEPSPFFRFPQLQHNPADDGLSRHAQRRDILLRPRFLRFPARQHPGEG